MGTIADRYRRNADAFTARVAAAAQLGADGWASPSPCEGWDAREIVRHVVDTSARILDQVGEGVAGVPDVDDDPVGAWATIRTAMTAALDEPAVATRTFDGMFGPSVFESTVDQFMSTDLTVHTWDLARAIGVDDRLDPDEVTLVFARMEAIAAQAGDMMRTSGAFGPAIELPDDADPQDKLIAFTGRTP